MKKLIITILVLLPFLVYAGWKQAYDELADTDIADADAFLILDASDTSMASTGTTKYFLWSSLIAGVGDTFAPLASPTFSGTITTGTVIQSPTGTVYRPSTTTDEHYIELGAYGAAGAYVPVVRVVNDTGGTPEFQLQANTKMTGLGFSNTKILELTSDELSDTSTPHGLTAAEVSGTILTNYDSSAEAKEYDLPPAAEGYNFIFRIILAQNVTLDPDGTEIMYLNGTAMAAGEAIVNTSPTAGESITCMTHQTGASAWQWFCDSADTDFTEATPP